jgi:hypothetical protein
MPFNIHYIQLWRWSWLQVQESWLNVPLFHVVRMGKILQCFLKWHGHHPNLNHIMLTCGCREWCCSLEGAGKSGTLSHQSSMWALTMCDAWCSIGNGYGPSCNFIQVGLSILWDCWLKNWFRVLCRTDRSASQCIMHNSGFNLLAFHWIHQVLWWGPWRLKLS